MVSGFVVGVLSAVNFVVDVFGVWVVGVAVIEVAAVVDVTNNKN